MERRHLQDFSRVPPMQICRRVNNPYFIRPSSWRTKGRSGGPSDQVGGTGCTPGVTSRARDRLMNRSDGMNKTIKTIKHI
jgi:hypothetical protein